MFARKQKQQPLGPVTGWKIVTVEDGGRTSTLSGLVFGLEEKTILNYVDAIANGLRLAGYKPQVVLTHESTTER